MSFQAMAWAVDQPLGGVGKLVLLLLANYAGKDGICFPSQTEMARQAGVSDRTIRTWLIALERDGYISRENRHRKDGTQTSDLITINIPKPQNTYPEISSTCKPIRRKITTGQAEKSSAYYKEEPITEPITKRENPILKKKWLSLDQSLQGVIGELNAPRRSRVAAHAK